jgi:tRNA(Ile)-lysidine synthase
VIQKAKGDLKRITLDHVDRVWRFAEQEKKGGCLHLPDNILICKDQDRIMVSRESQSLRTLGMMAQGKPHAGFSYAVQAGDGVTIKELGWRITLVAMDREKAGNICSSGQGIAFFDIEKAKFPLILRNFHSHDRFMPLGMTGSQSVTKFLKDHKVPADQWHRVPVLMSEEKVVWVVGHRIDEAFKVTEKTKKIIKAEICCT